MGLLRVAGTIDITQFWPQGESDADTTKVLVDISNGSFEFQDHASGVFRATHAFDKAQSKGKATKPVIDKKNRITVRLQGIDAPELHYVPSPLGRAKVTQAQRDAYKKVSKRYRQHLGETAVIALSAEFAAIGEGSIACTVETKVDAPNEVFDTYGRFIGDIFVKRSGKRTNINDWLLSEGWAFPAFYNTMTKAEIEEKIAAAKMGRKQKNRLWKYFTKNLERFDPALLYRLHGVPDPQADKGPVLFPKIYRRQTTWWARKKAGILRGGFSTYLRTNEATAPDRFLYTDDFLTDPASARQHAWDAILSGQAITRDPEELVFVEDPSTLVGPDGKPITHW